MALIWTPHASAPMLRSSGLMLRYSESCSRLACTVEVERVRVKTGTDLLDTVQCGFPCFRAEKAAGLGGGLE